MRARVITAHRTVRRPERTLTVHSSHRSARSKCRPESNRSARHPAGLLPIDAFVSHTQTPSAMENRGRQRRQRESSGTLQALQLQSKQSNCNAGKSGTLRASLHRLRGCTASKCRSPSHSRAGTLLAAQRHYPYGAGRPDNDKSRCEPDRQRRSPRADHNYRMQAESANALPARL